MKLRDRYDHEPAFVTIIFDRDADDDQVTFHQTEQEAEDYLRDRYGEFPSTDEPGGNVYEPGELPNTDAYTVTVLRARVLKRVLI